MADIKPNFDNKNTFKNFIDISRGCWNSFNVFDQWYIFVEIKNNI